MGVIAPFWKDLGHGEVMRQWLYIWSASVASSLVEATSMVSSSSGITSPKRALPLLLATPQIFGQYLPKSLLYPGLLHAHIGARNSTRNSNQWII